MSRLVLVRHGQSVWNKENRFTGWVDVPLTDLGVEEALRVGSLLKKEGIYPDIAFTSLLSRAILTTFHALSEMDRLWIPKTHSWRLNERHYGALAGLDRASTIELYGPEKVHAWRRSYLERPPSLEDVSVFANDPRYQNLKNWEIPKGESLKDVESRLMPFWYSSILPKLQKDGTILIGAHGNSLRALVKNLENIGDKEVEDLEIPTGEPRLYELTTRKTGCQVSPPVILR